MADTDAAELLLGGPAQDFCLEVDLGPLSRFAEAADVLRSPWRPLPLPPPPGAAPHALSIVVDLDFGGKARRLLRDALYAGALDEGAVRLSVLVAPGGQAEAEAQYRAARMERLSAPSSSTSRAAKGSPTAAAARRRRAAAVARRRLWATRPR